MLIYHGTSAAAVPCILKDGLQPRRISGVQPTSNDPICQGHPDCVYLAYGYASFFAADKVGSDEGEAAILEIDSNLLNPGLFLPDDYVLGQLLSGDPGRAHDSNEKIAAEARDGMTQLNSQWEKSLELMGTCAYHGTVPPAAIKRVCYIDFLKMKPAMFFDITDIGVSVQAFSVCAAKYRMVDGWFWGGDVKFGYGLVSNQQLKRRTDYKRAKKAFSELWSDRSMVRIENCL